MICSDVMTKVFVWCLIPHLPHLTPTHISQCVKVNKGLAELTRYYLLANNIRPETLFQYCDPPSLEGLFSGNATQDYRESITPDVPQVVSGKGWNYIHLYGNCVLLDVQKLWFREDVQRYISLVVSSGGHFRFRWNEQSVISELHKTPTPAHTRLAICGGQVAHQLVFSHCTHLIYLHPNFIVFVQLRQVLWSQYCAIPQVFNCTELLF